MITRRKYLSLTALVAGGGALLGPLGGAFVLSVDLGGGRLVSTRPETMVAQG